MNSEATRHTFAIFVMDTNSDLAAFVGRRDQPHFCPFHDTARFLFKECMEYDNRHNQMLCIKFGDNWMRGEQAN
jgi:hypothetical protein